MIHLIGIGKDAGNITLNAFKAIKDSDIIINYDNLDLSFFDSEIKDKEIISAIDIINEELFDLYSEDSLESDSNLDSDAGLDGVSGLDSDTDLNSASNLEDDLNLENLNSIKANAFLEKLQEENHIIEMAIAESLKGQEIAFIVYEEPSFFGISNRFIQIASKYSSLEYRIYPGVSSLDMVTSILGAPIGDFAAINLSNPLMSLDELETKVKNILGSDLVLVVLNPIDDRREDGRETFNKLLDLINETDSNLLMASVFSDGITSIKKFNYLSDEETAKLDKDTVFIIGNKLSYLLDGKMVSSSEYIVEPEMISYNVEFFEKYLKGESPRGLDFDCEYLPCHKELEACDFCYCPFYPCADGVTGGYWIKDRNIWSCEKCTWIHEEQADLAIREGLDEILKTTDDLKDKHFELLKLRRKCLLKTFNQKIE